MGGGIELPLSQGLVAIIDEQDYPILSQYRWCAAKCRHTFVACRGTWRDGRTKKVYLHRLIMNAPQNSLVDHINGDGLDNRRCNLRICTKKENNRNRTRMQSLNTSGFRGAFWEHGCKKWRAQISVNNKNHHIGVFHSKHEAASAYQQAAKRLYGIFAPGGAS